MMIGSNADDRNKQQTNSSSDSNDEKTVLSKEEATQFPRGRGKQNGFGATKGKCNLGAGAERW